MILYMVLTRYFQIHDVRIDLFTSKDEAIKCAKHLIRVGCLTPESISEVFREGDGGFYYIGNDGLRMSVTVSHKFTDCCWK